MLCFSKITSLKIYDPLKFVKYWKILKKYYFSPYNLCSKPIKSVWSRHIAPYFNYFKKTDIKIFKNLIKFKCYTIKSKKGKTPLVLYLTLHSAIYFPLYKANYFPSRNIFSPRIFVDIFFNDTLDESLEE